MIKGIFVTLYLLQVAFEEYLNYLDNTYFDKELPDNVKDVYDEETYRKWRAYHAEKARFGILESTASFLIELALLALNAYAAFAGLFGKHPVTQTFAVLLLSSLAELLLTPFAWHETMVIDEKYGFNKSTAKTFWADQVKEFVISLGLMTGIGALLHWLWMSLGD